MTSSTAAADARGAGGGDRPWLAFYPPGVPATIDEARIGTLADMFLDSVGRFAERPALESFGHRMTYAELGEAAAAVRSWLRAQGLAKGDRVAIMMPNVLAYPAALFGGLTGGFAIVSVNPLYTARELTHQLNDSGARILFVLENFAATVEEAWPNLRLDRVVIVKPGDLMGPKGVLVNLISRYVKRAVKASRLPNAVSFRSVVAAGRAAPAASVTVEPDDVAFLQYTGGTTGAAKGATLLHRNVAANLAQSEAWVGPSFVGRDDLVMVTALPLYHILALMACGLFMCRIGACQLLVANPRDIPAFVKILKHRRFTCMVLVNTLYNALLNHPETGEVDFSKLAFCISGGMATQEAVARRWKELTGKPIIEGYGLSETSPLVCCNPIDLAEFSGTIGYPVPSTDIAIRSAEDEALPMGQAGELCVKGPQVMAGYWNSPDETARAMTPDGFFRTGDVAVLLPDGQVKIVDRMKDMVLVSGFNVYPNEVEGVLVSHPGVLEAAVIGLPDEHSGEAVAAYVVAKDPALTAEALRDFCRRNLTAYKVPRRIEFRDSLPKTNVGKVLRRALRKDALAGKGA